MSTTDPRCEHCPVDAGLPCPGVSPGRRGHAVPRYCTLAASDPRYHDVIRREASLDADGPPPEPALPGLVAQAVNFAAAMSAHAANGFKIASTDVQASRLAICATCEFYRGSDQRCAKCGCGLPAKVELASSYCPVGKWSADDSA